MKYYINKVEYSKSEFEEIFVCAYCGDGGDAYIDIMREDPFGDYVCEEEKCVYDMLNQLSVIEVHFEAKNG